MSTTSGVPVFGLSGALVPQLIAGVVLWKVLARSESSAVLSA